MLKIKKTDISLTRGDSAYISLQVTDGSGNPVILSASDSVRCQVRDKANDGELLFEGEITTDTTTDEDGNESQSIVWHIRPQDTTSADLTKSYVWDAQVEFSNGDIFTFIPLSTFTIMDEVTLQRAGGAGG